MKAQIDQSKLIQDHDDIGFINTFIPCGVLIAKFDTDFTITHANQGYFNLIGYTKEEIFEKYQNKGYLTLHPEEAPKAIRLFQQQISENKDKTFAIKTKLINSTHGYSWVFFTGKVKFNAEGQETIYCLLVDISEELALLEQLNKEQEYSSIIFKLTDDTLFDFNIETSTIKFSQNFSNRFKVPMYFSNFPHSFVNNTHLLAKEHKEPFFKMVLAASQGDTEGNGKEICFITHDGNEVWFSQYYSIIRDSQNKPIRIIGKLTDITKQKIQLAELTEQAVTDSLTKLLNKVETHKQIEHALLEKKNNDISALIMIDIDNFKGINDNLGHQFGDTVLVDIAHKIKELFRESDIIGRVGGDEFIIFLKKISKESIVSEKAIELCTMFRNNYSGKQHEYKISGSIGIALSSISGNEFTDLYNHADMALYESKHKGKDCFTIYSPHIKSKVNKVALATIKVDRLLAKYFSENIIYTVFEMLYETKDINTTLNKILSIIGKKVQASRAYIFALDHEGNCCNNTHEWCAPNITSEINNLQNCPLSYLEYFFEFYNEDGVLACNNIRTLDDNSYSLLHQQDIKSILHCAFFEDGRILGFVGFDDCLQYRRWSDEEIATLTYVARILFTFITKNRLKMKLNPKHSII